MIVGSLTIDPARGAVHTHRDSYLIDTLTAVSVRRPLLPAGFVFGTGLAGFGIAFGDLLYPGEIAALAIAAVLALASGWQIGRLALLSRDLRGSELSGAIWGRHAALQRIRSEIVAAILSNRSTS
ncbi:hypothetical protein [Bosea sp. (in: a-proteobacteria)]|jgi:hypothetical protein|uniref:hypothetical protein n=1 Tax=Bosea sp. (in: a-proteobacteria) TaxID=1871050 RepID=UPI00356212F5